MTLPPSEALGQLTSCVISANAPSMSRLLNAEYACSIMVLVSAIHPPITLATHSIIRAHYQSGTKTYHLLRLRRSLNVFQAILHPEETIMPFARIDLLKGKTAEYRATVADVVY